MCQEKNILFFGIESDRCSLLAWTSLALMRHILVFIFVMSLLKNDHTVNNMGHLKHVYKTRSGYSH